MKKTLLLFLLVLPFFGFAQLAAGLHLINSLQAAPYNNLQAAITSLNGGGITGTGNVILLLDQDQSISSPIIINRADLTAAKGLIIQPNTGKNIIITGATGNTATSTLLKIDGADYVTIDGSNNGTTSSNLTITNTSTTNYNNVNEVSAAMLWIANKSTPTLDAATYNVVKNVKFVGSNVDPTSATSAAIVISETTSMQTAETTSNSYNTISSNSFSRVKFGIWVLGGTGTNAYNQNLTIDNNTFGSTAATDVVVVNAIKLSNTQNTTVSNNKIVGVASSSNSSFISGINLYNKSLNCNIFQNKISSVKSAGLSSGIHVNIDTNVTSNLTIYNNFINGIYSSAGGQYDSNNAGHGIYYVAGKNINLFFNTIALDQNQTGMSACLFIADGSNLDIRNNIFYNSQSGSGFRYGIYTDKAKSIFTTINRNDYVANTAGSLGFLGRVAGANISTIADWRIATSQDLNSLNTAPTFVGAGDLHLATNNTNNNSLIGETISTISTDIDNKFRSIPYMGAHELNGCSPTGDQVTYGTDYWKGYVYTYTGSTPTAATYVGSIAEKATFDRNVDTGSITGDATVEPNALCIAPNDKFMVRYLLQTTLTSATAGAYNITIGGDDGVRLYIDGVLATVSPTNSWSGHAYTNYATQVNLSAGLHKFILEYFEDDRSSRVSFSYGRVQVGAAPPLTTYPFGDNKWNVYGFTLPDITLPPASYAGMYVDTSLNINTQNSWPASKSPSSAASWQGAPMGIDNFAITYKRQGFPCGVYKLDLLNVDDDAEVYINGTRIFTRSGYSGSSIPVISGQFLNQNSTVEVRLKEDGGNANIALSFTDTPVVYNGSGAITPSTTSIRISANSTLNNDIEVCSCTVDAGVTFTIPVDKTLTVDENIIVAGTGTNAGKLLLENGASLLQKNTATTAYQGATNTFEMQRNTAFVRRYDWTYWSSPVSLASGFTLYNLSPDTLLDKYNSYDAQNSKWTYYLNGAQVMTPAVGYTVRAPQQYSITSSQVYTAKFKGIPNNGNYTVQVYANKYNLIGNPYPSAIDADQLISVNSDAGVPVGALYFWTHISAAVAANPSTGTTSYSSDDYAIYSKTGGILTSKAKSDPTTNSQPLGKIAAGQSFFMLASVQGLVTFTNGMRISANNKQFYKTTESNAVEKNRLWLNLSNTDGAFKQALVGYIDGATNNWDIDYDARTIDGNSYIDFYSINNANKLTIQGRELPFDNSDRVPLGYKTAIAGDFNIGIDHADGLFNDQDVYLEDKLTGKVQDLRAGDYTFTTEIGTFTDRFTISYVKKTLGTGDFESLENSVLVSVKNKAIKVNSTKENISEVTIYDITGRILYNKKKVESTELPISNLQSSNQVLLVKVKLENDYLVTKKIIFN